MAAKTQWQSLDILRYILALLFVAAFILKLQFQEARINALQQLVLSGDGMTVPAKPFNPAGTAGLSQVAAQQGFTRRDRPTPLPGVKLFGEEAAAAKRARRRVHPEGYGGSSDAYHLGGFLRNDTSSFEPMLWDWLLSVQKISSFLDVGCGMGYSSKWFMDRGVEVLCVEGSNEAVEQTLLPQTSIVQHDFTRGAWWPEKVYDIAWSVEVLEHVQEQYLDNLMAVYKSARYVFVTHSVNDGWHHVNVHHGWWWIEKFHAYGFQYARELTEVARKLSRSGRKKTYFGTQGLIFRNPNYPEQVWKEPATMKKRTQLGRAKTFLRTCDCFFSAK